MCELTWCRVFDGCKRLVDPREGPHGGGEEEERKREREY